PGRAWWGPPAGGTCVDPGPGWSGRPRAAASYTDTPSTSAGSRSEVNCTRWKDSPTVAARAWARVVLPSPGRSSIRTWPPASRATNARRTSCGLPSTSELTCSWARERAFHNESGRICGCLPEELAIACLRYRIGLECNGMRDESGARRAFLVIWTIACVVKLLVATRLPLFVDEAFYWQEGRHLAPAYSDLPGMTAWLARLGTFIGGEHPLALRMPFLLLGALVPWWVKRIGARWFGAVAGWHAGSLAVLMPLSGTLGVMALPDVPLAVATVLCLHAATHLLRQVTAPVVLELCLGLALGALSHYRFGGVLLAGGVVLLGMPHGRRLLEDPRVLLALAVGLLAWAPLLLWNLE